LPTCHAALVGCKRSPWRHPIHRRQMLAVIAGAQARILCNITVYAQVSHACLTDSMIETITFSTLVTRTGNGMPRAGSQARLAWQHGCRIPNVTPRVMVVGNGIDTET
ncbi:hypothetical protein, partial [Chloroflexus sp.]|uniref:hypothetical protein n=1 Tax=Chloroflexus sp. TaxID=1904827 RepID=UPI004049AF0E